MNTPKLGEALDEGDHGMARSERNLLAEAFIRGIEAGAEDPSLAGDGDAMYAAFREWSHRSDAPRDSCEHGASLADALAGCVPSSWLTDDYHGQLPERITAAVNEAGYVLVKRIDVLVARSFLIAPAANEFGQKQADEIAAKWREFQP